MHVFRTKRRKIIAAGLSVGLVMSMGGAAFAAWTLTATGTQTFTETAGTAGTGAILVTVANATDALMPGVAPTLPSGSGTFAVSLQNMSATASVAIHGAVVSIVNTSAGASCAPSNFTLTQPSWSDGTKGVAWPQIAAPMVAYATDMPGGVRPTLELNANAPDACQSVTVNLLVTVS
jgi:hypothetical protein